MIESFVLVALRLIYYSEDFKYGGIFLETDFGTELAEYVPEKGGTTIDGEDEDVEFDEEEISMEVDESAVVAESKYKPTELNEFVGTMDEIDKILDKPEYAGHLSGYLFFRNEGLAHQEALAAAFAKSALPCLLTSLTTAIGMLALTLTPITQIVTFGFSSAAGVMTTFLFTVCLLPLMLDVWSPVPKSKKEGAEKRSGFLRSVLNRLLPVVEKKPTGIILLFLAIFLVCIYGATRVKVDSKLIEITREGHWLRTVYQVVDEHMMGTENMEILVDMGYEDALQDPKVLRAMEELQEILTAKYGNRVVRTYSLADVVKDAYKALNEDRPEMHIIPENRRMLSQTLFLFDNANPEDRRKLVSDNYSKSHISVQLYNAGSYEYTAFFRDVRADIDDAFAHLKDEYPKMGVSVTGRLALVYQLSFALLNLKNS